MKISYFLTVVICMFCFSDTFAEGRVIGYIQQEQPGHIVVATFVETKNKFSVSVRSLGAETKSRIVDIKQSEFEQLWEVVKNKEASEFEYIASEDENVTDPAFYTIQLSFKNEKKMLRIPTDESKGKGIDIVNLIKTMIK